jgi:hypothetical protein
MKKIGDNQLHLKKGGGNVMCDATMDGLWAFATGAIAIGGPGGLALGITIGATTLLLHAAGACR